MPIRRGTQPLPSTNGSGRLPAANPAGSGALNTPAAGTPPAGTPAVAPAGDAATLSGRPGTSRLSLPGSVTKAYDAGSGANNAYNAATGVATNLQGAAEGLGQMADGNYVQGAITTGQGVVGAINDAGGVAAGTRTAASLMKGGDNVLGRAADRVTARIGEGSKVATRTAGAGGMLAAAGGGLQVYNGIQQMREGKGVEGGLTAAGGAISVAQGVGSAAQALAPAGKLATSVGLRAAPVLGVLSGGIQTAQALAKTPPDYTSAATGAMTTIGSALMPFPPVGTAVGGALVVGAAIVDNWGAISGAANMVGGKVGDAANAIGEGAANMAKAAGDGVRNAAGAVRDSIGGW